MLSNDTRRALLLALTSLALGTGCGDVQGPDEQALPPDDFINTEAGLSVTESATLDTFIDSARAGMRFDGAQALDELGAGLATGVVHLLGTGRVLVSPELRAAAGIERDTMLLGMGNHFELWDKATYEAKEAEAIAGDMPDVFKDFSF